MISDIFLDFFNRDSREIFGLFANASREKHVAFLTEATNVAVFLCKEQCILPPGFLAECEIARDAILRRADYVVDRLIRLPLREATLEEFWDKKRREYSPFRARYTGLFEHRNEVLLRRFSEAIITRNSRIADEILRRWEEGPDVSDVWKATVPGFRAGDIEIIRKTPREIRDEGIAVTWPAILNRIKDLKNARSSRLRYILQNHYFQIYLREYDLLVITRLPFARTSFVPANDDLTNDYESLKAALTALGVWNIVTGLSAESMISFRSKTGYYQFRMTFDRIAREMGSAWAVGQCFAQVVTTSGSPRGFRSILSKYGQLPVPTHGYEAIEVEVDAMADRMGNTEPAEREMAKIKLQKSERSIRGLTPDAPTVAICVALELERQVLVKQWKLTGEYPDQLWRGTVGGVNVVLFGTDEMGRVSAAVATMQFLQENPKPAMLVVAGIAGGFAREKVKLGDVLIPKSVADLATRKVGKTKGRIPEFRPREFRTDTRILKYVRSGSFDIRSWEPAVIDAAEWPDGLRPTIHDGPIASLDEVVSSTEWVDTLCKAWPKLCGVEMESGGVCAAAEVHDLKVAVVRGVSDLADPAKSDDAWRLRAMKTVAHLLETIDFARLLAE